MAYIIATTVIAVLLVVFFVHLGLTDRHTIWWRLFHKDR